MKSKVQYFLTVIAIFTAGYEVGAGSNSPWLIILCLACIGVDLRHWEN